LGWLSITARTPLCAQDRALKCGSSGRTRTCNLVVTSAPKFLLGLDYLFTRFRILKGGCRALPLRQPQSTSIGSSLCTFPDRFCSTRAWLRVTVSRFPREAGFPEFTRFFNHDFSWKLHLYSHPLCQLSYRGAGGDNLARKGREFKRRPRETR